MRDRPRSREGRQPAPEEQDGAQAGDGDHAGVFGDKKHREFEAGVFGVKATDQLLLRFRQIEGSAVGFRNRRSKKAEEAENLRPEIPAEKAPFGMARLRIDN